MSRVAFVLDFAAAAALAFAIVSRRAADDFGVCCSVGLGLGARVGVDIWGGDLKLEGLEAIGAGEDILVEDCPKVFVGRVLALLGLDRRIFEGVVSLGFFGLI